LTELVDRVNYNYDKLLQRSGKRQISGRRNSQNTGSASGGRQGPRRALASAEQLQSVYEAEGHRIITAALRDGDITEAQAAQLLPEGRSPLESFKAVGVDEKAVRTAVGVMMVLSITDVEVQARAGEYGPEPMKTGLTKAAKRQLLSNSKRLHWG
jgi:hypothetical protein